MSKRDKAMERLKGRPRDYTWDEAVSVLCALGYEEQSGSGSRRKFRRKTAEGGDHIISLHRPHPGNTLKLYLVDELIESLTEQGLI